MDIAETGFQTNLPPFVTGDTPCHKICHAANPDRIRLFYTYISIVTVNKYRYNIIVCMLYLYIVWDMCINCVCLFFLSQRHKIGFCVASHCKSGTYGVTFRGQSRDRVTS